MKLSFETLTFQELLIFIFVVLEVVVVLAAIVALVVVRERAIRSERQVESARRSLLDALAHIGSGAGEAGMPLALAAVASLTKDHARRLLTELAEGAGTGGSRVLDELYAKAGLAAEARANAQSRPWERLRAIREARALSDPARLLSVLLTDEVADVRLGAFEAMCTLGRADEAMAALPVLVHDGRLNRVRVIDALSSTEPIPLVALVEHSHSETPEVRQVVVAVLGTAQVRSAVDVIVHAVTDIDAEVRIQALKALYELGDVSLLKTSLGALQDPRWEVRSEAVKTCGRLGGGGAAEAIAVLLDDEAEWVRHNASLALSRCGPSGIAALRNAAGRGNASASSALAEARMQAAEPRSGEPEALDGLSRGGVQPKLT